jgi:DNA (cytosine-5)-methyltransferase 1
VGGKRNSIRFLIMKYFDTFTGIGAGTLAIQSIFPEAECVGFSEIDKYCEAVYKYHYPNHINYGDISLINIDELPDFDLLIGGFSCQPYSIAGNRKGLEDPRGQIIYPLLDILRRKRPKYFIFENVASMSNDNKEALTNLIEQACGSRIEFTQINSALVSAQTRKRIYWVGRLVNGKYEKVEVPQPEDRGILLKDILEQEVGSKYYINADNNLKLKNSPVDSTTTIRVGQFNSGGQGDRIYSEEGKSVTLSANGGGRGAKTGIYLINKAGGRGEKELTIKQVHYIINIINNR